MKYKIFDLSTNKDITNEEAWVITPDGEIRVNEYGDLIGRYNIRAVFYNPVGKELFSYEQPSCVITTELILSGIKERLITFGVDPNMGSGTVCRIGDGWFYFGGFTAEEMNPDEYLANVPMEDIVREIHETLDEFSRDEELRDEYEYYKAVLVYKNGYGK